MAGPEIKALTFDVFGTVVDWRTSVAREADAFFKKHGITSVDGIEFAMEWRKLYQPQMEKVRSGEMPFTKLDVLHRMNLDMLFERYGIGGISEEETDYLNRAWHRLDPWPDSVEGLTRLKKKFIIATQSNGNIALMVNMAKYAGLPWDVILGSEVVRHYKPCPDAYINCADALGLPPESCMMTAAHNNDLVAASRQGFRTAFVLRPVEYGPDQDKDTKAEHDFDYIADSFIDLADQLDCPK
jgi:2-haloacid dehalogenase